MLEKEKAFFAKEFLEQNESKRKRKEERDNKKKSKITDKEKVRYILHLLEALLTLKVSPRKKRAERRVLYLQSPPLPRSRRPRRHRR